MAASSTTKPLSNTTCVRYGFWLASSYYSTTSDRYRVQEYKNHARVNLYGQLVAASLANLWSAYSPITEADFSYPQGHTPFQIATKDAIYPARARSFRLVQESFNAVQDADLSDSAAYWYPQAFRSDGAVAVAVIADGAGGLRLTIVDVKPNGCTL